LYAYQYKLFVYEIIGLEIFRRAVIETIGEGDDDRDELDESDVVVPN
jgi:hypothetical protein